MSKPKLYLAGPTVFMADAIGRGARLKEACEIHGCEGLFPLDTVLVDPTARDVYQACMDMISKANGVVADLSPFRGPHVDDGTAFELGVANARGLPIFGYSSDLRLLLEKIAPASPGEHLDADGIQIENFGQPFNAMIAGALSSPAYSTPEEAIAAAAKRLLLPR